MMTSFSCRSPKISNPPTFQTAKKTPTTNTSKKIKWNQKSHFRFRNAIYLNLISFKKPPTKFNWDDWPWWDFGTDDFFHTFSAHTLMRFLTFSTGCVSVEVACALRPVAVTEPGFLEATKKEFMSTDTPIMILVYIFFDAYEYTYIYIYTHMIPKYKYIYF